MKRCLKKTVWETGFSHAHLKTRLIIKKQCFRITSQNATSHCFLNNRNSMKKESRNVFTGDEEISVPSESKLFIYISNLLLQVKK